MSGGAGEIVVVAVKAGSRKGPLVDVAVEAGQPWTVYVREPAVEGRANRAVRRLLAEHFGVPPSRVTLVAGATAKIKRFRVER